jgi:glycosyltransferase involved in cell wall biosynthesis
MQDVFITIITPSLNKESVLLDHYDWFSSLCREDLELIIVDQNSNQANSTLQNFSGKDGNFVYLYNPIKGLSLNRNYASKFASGKYIIYLDDDARFNADFIDKVKVYLKSYDVDILLCGVVDHDMQLTSYTPFSGQKNISIWNIEHKVNSNGLIVSRKLLSTLEFDQRMGVGAEFGSSEETDFVVKALISGHSVRYNGAINVIHPVAGISGNKAFSYGKGHGFFTQKLVGYLKSSFSFALVYLISIKLLRAILKMFFGSLFSFSHKGNLYKNWCRGFLSALYKRTEL